jgi:hypothetical protein
LTNSWVATLKPTQKQYTFYCFSIYLIILFWILINYFEFSMSRNELLRINCFFFFWWEVLCWCKSSKTTMPSIGDDFSLLFYIIWEDTKGVTRNRKSKKNIQYNDQKKKDKNTSNDLQYITQKTNDWTIWAPLSKTVWFMVFSATFNNSSVILWRSVLFMKETGVPGEHHRPVASHWQTLSHNTKQNGVSSVLQKGNTFLLHKIW